MARKFFISIPGPPRGWDRTNSFNGRQITPKWMRAHKALIQKLFNAKYPRHEPMTGPLMVRMTAVFAIPKSFNAKQHQAALEGKLFVTKRPDKDNIEKLIYDSLNKLAWVDDSQCSGGCIKRYGEPERIDVSIEELHNPVETPADKQRRAKQDQFEMTFRRVPRRAK